MPEDARPPRMPVKFHQSIVEPDKLADALNDLNERRMQPQNIYQENVNGTINYRILFVELIQDMLLSQSPNVLAPKPPGLVLPVGSV